MNIFNNDLHLFIAGLNPSQWFPIQGPSEDWLWFCLASLAHNLGKGNEQRFEEQIEDLRRTSYWAWADKFALVMANWSLRRREAGGRARERLETPLAVVTFRNRQLYSCC